MASCVVRGCWSRHSDGQGDLDRFGIGDPALAERTKVGPLIDARRIRSRQPHPSDGRVFRSRWQPLHETSDGSRMREIDTDHGAEIRPVPSIFCRLQLSSCWRWSWRLPHRSTCRMVASAVGVTFARRSSHSCPFTPSAFLAFFHSRRLMAGNPAARAKGGPL